MPDSNFMMFQGENADWSNPEHVKTWLDALPPTTLPPTKRTAHVGFTHEGKRITVRVTRAAQVAIAGGGDLSTIEILEQFGELIDIEIAAMVKRGPEPATGWLLDVGALVTVA